jgi:hypothetical protein
LIDQVKEGFQMRRRVYLGAIVLVMVFLSLACGRTYYSYMPTTEFPRMVYIDKADILNLGTVAARLYAGNTYAEVTTRDGVIRTGKLLRIDEGELMMSPSYYYEMSEESSGKVDVEEVIPKDQILILKVY